MSDPKSLPLPLPPLPLPPPASRRRRWPGLCRAVLLLAGFCLLASARLATAETYTLAQVEDAAKAGNRIAQRELGRAYYLGHLVPQDYNQAFYWLLKAGTQHDPIAQSFLGRLYEEGKGVPKDTTKAFDWYLRAANQEEAFSQYRVGCLYLEGQAIKADPAAGFTYLLHAASQDFPPAQLAVANCYAKGVYVKADPVLAYKWAFLAAIESHEAARALPGFRKNMTPAQIDAGQVAVEDWGRRSKYGVPQHDLGVSLEGRSAQTKFLFANTNRDICIPVMLQNREAVYFIVDTGASTTVLDTEIADKLGLKGNDYIAFGAFGHQLAVGAGIGGVQLGLPGLTLTNAQVVISPMSGAVAAFSNAQPFGDKPLGGLLGSDILSHFVLHIDYAGSYIEFIAPEKFQPDPTAEVLPLDPRIHAPTLAATIQNGPRKSNPGNFLIDTGNSSAVSMSPGFLNKNPDLRLRVAVYSGVFGLGGPNPAPVGKCSSLTIGKTSVPKPVFVLAQPMGNAAMDGTIGNDIWRRFDVTIDFPNKKIYLKPNSAIDEPFTCNLYGLIIKELGKIPPSYIISKVWEGSAAAAMGLKAGDKLEKVNGIEPAQVPPSKLHGLLNREGVLQLVITRDGGLNRQVTLKSSVLPEPESESR